MNIKEWIKDPFGGERFRREREKTEETGREGVINFIEEVINPSLRVDIAAPKITFAAYTLDDVRIKEYRGLEYREGEVFINWMELWTAPPGIKQNHNLFALVVIGHELGHYIQDKLKLALHKETYGISQGVGRGILQHDLGKKEVQRLRAISEDQSDYLAGVFIRYLIRKGALNLSEQVCDALSRAYAGAGNRFFERNRRGHGSRGHRRNLFEQGLKTQKFDEEVKLIFKEY